MKVSEQCYPCLTHLVEQASALATEDTELRKKAIDEGLKLLEREFMMDKVSIHIATPLHRVIRSVTGNPDPYLQMKETEIKMARELTQKWASDPPKDLRSAIIIAVQGNIIDFFKDINEIEEDIAKPTEFAIDHTKALEVKLKDAKNILYLADNSGEVLFDLPLVNMMSDFGEVTYVVKESPVQNDITLSDLERFDLMKEFKKVITTGTDTPGVIMEIASDEFKSAYDSADLVLAKGMGYWETQSEFPPEGKVFHLLKAKCQPVADSLSVSLNDYVALLR